MHECHLYDLSLYIIRQNILNVKLFCFIFSYYSNYYTELSLSISCLSAES